MMKYPVLRLKKGEEQRIRSGHPWIFSNEIDTQKTPMKSFAAGDIVTVKNQSDQSMGLAYINPHCLLSARLLTRDVNETIDENWFFTQFKNALTFRENLFDRPYYRWVYGESDFLPGLIVDRFDDTVVLQLNTAGMEKQESAILHAIEKLISPSRIILRNESHSRELEGLEKESRIVKGGEEPLQIIENKVVFEASPLEGQKTGWFYDHRYNRELMTRFVKDKMVLDVCSYVGGWTIQAAVAGAKHVTAIDSSEAALMYLQKNAEKNKVADKITTLKKDAFAQLEALHQEGKKYDVIILDPPAFIKRKKDLDSGYAAYLRLNRLAMLLLKPQGILISCSCSSFLDENTLIRIGSQAAYQNKTSLRVFLRGSQGMDHPIHTSMPETQYLKAVFLKN